jgi:arylformamidase
MSVALTAEQVERGYNNRAAVADHAAWFARWGERSREAMAALDPRLDIRYGPGPKETLDVFLPAGPPRGTLVFIHGGYWRSLDKAEHAFVAPAFVAEGFAVVVPNYDLCPAVSVGDIANEMTRAIAFLLHDGAHIGVPAKPLVVSGHSAGGHLAAMLLATRAATLGWPTHPVTGAVSLSGVHDLEPLVQFSYNVDLKLDVQQARLWSPVHMPAQTRAPLLLSVGALETGEFLRQTDLMWDAWPDNRPPGATAPLVVPDRHHFDVVMGYEDRDSALSRATLALF